MTGRHMLATPCWLIAFNIIAATLAIDYFRWLAKIITLADIDIIIAISCRHIAIDDADISLPSWLIS
jgi:hypothetical protein